MIMSLVSLRGRSDLALPTKAVVPAAALMARLFLSCVVQKSLQLFPVTLEHFYWLGRSASDRQAVWNVVENQASDPYAHIVAYADSGSDNALWAYVHPITELGFAGDGRLSSDEAVPPDSHFVSYVAVGADLGSVTDYCWLNDSSVYCRVGAYVNVVAYDHSAFVNGLHQSALLVAAVFHTICANDDA